MHYDVCCIMTFVALWRLSHYDFFRIMTIVALWRLSLMTFVSLWRLSLMTFVVLWRLSHYDVCCIMTFVVYDVCRIKRRLWRLSHYDVCRIMTFVALWRLSFMTFVVLWCLLHYDVCRQLWRLSLIGFVAVSKRDTTRNSSSMSSIIFPTTFHVIWRKFWLLFRQCVTGSYFIWRFRLLFGTVQTII